MANGANLCGGCKYWHPTDKAGNGECRLNPPVVVIGTVTSFCAWPTPSASQWCGQFSPGQPAAVAAGEFPAIAIVPVDAAPPA